MPHVPEYVHGGYSFEGIERAATDAMIPNAVKMLTRWQKKYGEFDAIAFRGMSGAMVAPILAHLLGKTLIMVRKGENCHSCHGVEGDAGADSYIIVDDFLSTGDTIEQIVTAVQSEWADDIYTTAGKLKFLGTFEYAHVKGNGRITPVKMLNKYFTEGNCDNASRNRQMVGKR